MSLYHKFTIKVWFSCYKIDSQEKCFCRSLTGPKFRRMGGSWSL